MPEQHSSLITPVNFRTCMCTPTHMAMTKIHFPFCLGLPQRGQCGEDPSWAADGPVLPCAHMASPRRSGSVRGRDLPLLLFLQNQPSVQIRTPSL